MIRFTFMLLIVTNLAYGFMIDHPVQGARIRDTRAFVATASRPLVEEAAQAPVIINQPATGKPKITQLKSAEDYRNFIEEDDRLCMIKFYAPYCKSCQKFGQQYSRIGKEIGELTIRNKDGSETTVREGEVRMAEMEYGSNKELCKSLGITKLPSIQFYSKAKLVESFSCGPRKIGMLLEKLSRFRSMTPAELEFEADMNQGIALGDSVLESLNIEIISETALPSC